MLRYSNNTIGAVALCVALAGCAASLEKDKTISADIATQAVSRAVAVAEQTLTGLERAALADTTLPACAASVAPPCADPVVKAKIKAVDQAAYDAVVRARNNTGSLADALVAIDALRAVLPVK